MTGFALPGRVPLWVDQRAGPATPVLLLHDLGKAPIDLRCLPEAWQVLALHQRGHGRSGRVRGGQYTLSDYAADAVRVLRLVQHPVVAIGLGRSALVAALAAAAEPTSVRAVALAPGTADPVCSEQTLPTRRAWVAAISALPASSDTVDAATGLPFAEPLYPDDRDQLWRSIPRPLGWSGQPAGRWAEGARPDVTVGAGADVVTSAVHLVHVLAATWDPPDR